MQPHRAAEKTRRRQCIKAKRGMPSAFCLGALTIDRSQQMKFMLMMNPPKGTGYWRVDKWAQDDLKAHIGFMRRFSKELNDAGELVGAEGLAAPGQARVVRAGKNGAPEVTDGPFPEAKEFLAGYWIV